MSEILWIEFKDLDGRLVNINIAHIVTYEKVDANENTGLITRGGKLIEKTPQHVKIITVKETYQCPGAYEDFKHTVGKLQARQKQQSMAQMSSPWDQLVRPS